MVRQESQEIGKTGAGTGIADHNRALTPALGALTLPYKGEPLDRALGGISDAGFTHLGLFPEHAGQSVLPSEPTSTDLATLRHKLELSGLRPWLKIASPGADSDASTLSTDLKACADLGFPALQLVGPWQYASSPADIGAGATDRKLKPVMEWFGEVEAFLAHLARAAREAERLGVTIVLKPHAGVCATGADIVNVIHRIGSAAVRGCWDAANIRFYEGLDSEVDLEESGVAPFIHTVSVKDHRGDAWEPDFPVPGDGDVDFARMLRIFIQAQYSGPLLVQRVGQPTPEATDAALAKAHSFLRNIVKTVSEDQ